jgi:hypothetical protein
MTLVDTQTHYSLESDVAIPPGANDVAFVIAKVTLVGGQVFNAWKGARWQDGADLIALIDRLTPEAEAEALRKAGVTGEVSLPSPLPVAVPPDQKVSPFRACTPGLPPDIAPERCAACRGTITDYFGGSIYLSATRVVEMTREKHGRPLCAPCSGKEAAQRLRRR